MIRVIYLENVMDGSVCSVMELEADKLTSHWWKRINAWAAKHAIGNDTHICTIDVMRVRDASVPWFDERYPGDPIPEGECLISGIADARGDRLTLTYYPRWRLNWIYREWRLNHD